MRAFIILAIIAAARADVGGYNYNAGTSGEIDDSAGHNSYGSTGGDAGEVGTIGGSGGNSVASDSFGNRGNVGSTYTAPSQQSELNKEFFTYTAPEEAFEDGQTLNDISSSLKKNLRVIFIRGPENHGINEAALNLAKSAVDSKTAIYVLNKQNDVSHLAEQLHNLRQNSQSHKPEVHFVKYRTPEDAAHAQQAIQRQYDNLGGTSQSHDGGVAPVLNFASQVPHSSSGGVSHGSVGGGYAAPAPPSAAYLPARF